MTQRVAFILAGVLTAFVLVVVGAAAAFVTQASGRGAASITPIDARRDSETTSPPSDWVSVDPPNRGQASVSAVKPTPPSTPQLPADAAGTIALSTMPGSRLMRTPELVDYQGTVAYEVNLDRGVLYLDAATGKVLYNGTAPSAPADGQPVSQEEAAQIASAYLGGGSIVDLELEREHGQRVYEVKFADGSKIYVDAATGQVVYAKIGGSRSTQSADSVASIRRGSGQGDQDDD